MGIGARNEAAALPGENASGAISGSFSILGEGIRLKGSPAEDVKPVFREYLAFRNDNVDPSWEIAWNGHVSPTTLTFDGKVHLGVPPNSASPIISTKIMDHVYKVVVDFYLFHGAAAAWGDVLLIFPGETGTGKSSLSLALTTGGWSLFSDEVIAISRESLEVAPFPRAIMAWSNSPALGEFLRAEEERGGFVPFVGKRMKVLIPFSLLNKPRAPLRAAAIVCLRGGRREAREGRGEIVATYWDERMENLAREKGIYGNLQISRVGEFWRIESDHMEIAEEICVSLGGLVIERAPVEERPAVFGETPLLEPISPSECLNALWSVFENGGTLTGGEERAVEVYVELAKMVKAIPSFWLRPGPPGPTCELLKNLAEKLGKKSVSRE
ncbi:hypothetical protein HQ563_05905 [bacterium]|nr:hypothetical protein [bacterium]